jgi:hypothetical protein
MTDTVNRECLGCGATSEPLARHAMSTGDRYDADLCEPCARTFAEAGLLAMPTSSAVEGTTPSSPSTA